MRSRLQQLESDLLQARVHSDRITAENERLSMRLSEAVKERDELKARTEQDRATLALLTARLKESEERIVSFNQLLDQAIEPFRSKLKLADDRIAKLTKENETLKTKKMQLLDKALDLKLKLKHIGGEGALPKPTPLSPDVSAYGGKYRRLPSIGAAAAQDENRLG
ncbi:hypothetical protein HK104_005847 [Borealophlyctis nickersoniae]|nr:hypothetical protein HK104_005847 [Borealophlyctis nickersoniae]